MAGTAEVLRGRGEGLERGEVERVVMWGWGCVGIGVG